MIICSDQKDNFYFRYLMHNYYKALFGATVVPVDDDDEVTHENDPIKYRILKNDLTGMKPRFFDGELLTMYLTPSQRKMNFHHLTSKNHEAINRLKTLDQNRTVQSKINYISKLNELIDDYCHQEKPFEKAKKLFSNYVVALYPTHAKILKNFTLNIYDDTDTMNALGEFIANAENEPKECYSGEMTIRKAIEFWLNPSSVQLGTGEADMGYLVRYAAVNFLLIKKNQSAMERTFGKIKRSAMSSRNNLKHESALREVIVREFKNNAAIFDTIFPAQKKGKKEEETEDEKKLRKVYNILKHSIFSS